jgi:hypothetical protein
VPLEGFAAGTERLDVGDDDLAVVEGIGLPSVGEILLEALEQAGPGPSGCLTNLRAGTAISPKPPRSFASRLSRCSVTG